MKQPFKIIALFLVLLCLMPVLVLAAGLSLPDYYQDSYYAELSVMYNRLKQTQGKKIVVVGGSNVAFGLDSALMEQLLREKGYDYTVCPFGLYAAVGTGAMLDLSRNTLGPGDIVILALEPTTETMSAYFGATAFWKCAEAAPELLLALDGRKQEALAGNYIAYLQERWAIRASGIPPKAEGVYAKASFNDRCDLSYDRPGNILALGYDTAAPVDLGGVTVAPEFAQQVNDYCLAAEKAGATVVLSFSPVNRRALVGDEAGVGRYFDLCNDTFHCQIISDPNRYILDAGWFYDSNFHLNTPGALVRTCNLAADVLAYLGCYEKVDYPLPQMPQPAAKPVESQGQAEAFTFAPVTDAAGNILGYRVSGLSETGLEAQELTVPAVYAGKTVVGFTADALASAGKLQSLRLPASIESLPDGLFRGCTALTRLILEHRDTPCDVTAHTFDGADQVKIFVPLDAYSLYRDGAGCTENPWTRYLSRIHTI